MPCTAAEERLVAGRALIKGAAEAEAEEEEGNVEGLEAGGERRPTRVRFASHPPTSPICYLRGNYLPAGPSF